MPVVVCPSCGARLNAPDAAVGKALKCPKCQTAVPVRAAKPAASAPSRRPADDEPQDLPPRRRPADDDDDEPDDRPRRKGKKRPQKSGAPVALIAGLLVFAVLAGGGFAAYWFGFRDKPPVAGPTNPADGPAVAKKAPVPDGWQVHDVAGCGFRVALPAPPVEDVPTSQGTAAFKATGRMFRSPAGGFAASPSRVLCGFGRVTPPATIPADRRRQAGMQAFKSDTIQDQPGAKVLGRKAAPVGGHPGEEVVVELPSGSGPQWFWVIRSAVVGDDVFVMAVWKENEHPPAAIVNGFFDSLDVVGSADWSLKNPPPTTTPTPVYRRAMPPTKTVSVEESDLGRLSLSPDGGTVGVTGRAKKADGGEPDFVCAYYDLSTGKRVGRALSLDAPGFIAAGGKTAVVVDRSSVFVREVATGQKTAVSDLPVAHGMYAASPDGKLVVTAAKSKLTFHPWPPGDAPAREVDAGSPIHAVSAVFLGGTRVATLQYDTDDVVVRVWDVKTGRPTDVVPLKRPQQERFPRETVQVAEDGVAMVTSSEQGTTVVWNLSEKQRMPWADAKSLGGFYRPTAGGRVFYHDSEIVREGGAVKIERFVAVAVISTGAVLKKLLYPPEVDSLIGAEVAASPDGMRFVAKNDAARQVLVWDLPK